ncbi:hypothetical protein I0Q91_12695 [Halanaerobiaceae bacterium Z-7014]|uniref:Uncharacterized protein n=1 Tax=Halonatronomonas betaini TaxID=2778430 RepID=A0A931ATL2_9FIRM|nr:hypothetical protein [Halonatronomonas betaini]MBF8437944.1 hypothetical protein [Halonatronomonas betaini]
MIFQVILFFIIFALFQYIVKSKNIWGLGNYYNSQKEVVISSVLTSFLATLIYFLLSYYLF